SSRSSAPPRVAEPRRLSEQAWRLQRMIRGLRAGCSSSDIPRSRSCLLRRAFGHASSVLAALPALAPRLVRFARHDYSDRLLAGGGARALRYALRRRRAAREGRRVAGPLPGLLPALGAGRRGSDRPRRRVLRVREPHPVPGALGG